MRPELTRFSLVRFLLDRFAPDRFSLAWAVTAVAVAFIACRSVAIETKPAISSETPHSAQAALRVHAGRRAPHAIPRYMSLSNKRHSRLTTT